jgi:hypothetical protein
VLGHQLQQRSIAGYGEQQHGEENLLFHGLMILIAKNSQEFQYGDHVENFNALALVQFPEHRIDDV